MTQQRAKFQHSSDNFTNIIFRPTYDTVHPTTLKAKSKGPPCRVPQSLFITHLYPALLKYSVASTPMWATRMVSLLYLILL